MGERFKVATVDGFRSIDTHGGGSLPGLSAHVLDTRDAHRCVATFRSEGRGSLANEIARGWTVMEAQVHAETLNAAERETVAG